ncbi:MAG: hypothetical protein IJ647_10215 [Prevotella sp.]|nr:hypothetical protein [Prevotella sp.]
MAIRVPDVLLSEDRFQVFAIEVLEDSRVGKRGLKGNTVYYLYRGYQVMDDGETIKVDNAVSDRSDVFNDYLLEQARQSSSGKTVPHVSISAIVGKNGSGKSTVVEFMLRLINNFSAMLFGEQLVGGGASHLHYIDGVQGVMYFFLDEEPLRLMVKNRTVYLDRYVIDDSRSTREYDVFKRTEDKHLSPMTEDADPLLEKVGEDNIIQPYIQHFFYTVVSNYSIYAYNTLDYTDENNSDEYERTIRRKDKNFIDSKVRIEPSDCNWLQGIFHKNDGYKTPLVLTPFRDRGNININVENTLSRERFISMLLMSYDGQGGFKRINGHLDVEHFQISCKGDYGLRYINDHLDIEPFTGDKYDDIRYQILAIWSDLLLRDEEHFDDYTSDKQFGEVALNYIVYKTIKIATKYADYAKVKDVFENYQMGKINLDTMIDGIYDYISDLREDRSHITRKIRQAMAYLLTPVEDDVYASDNIQLEVSSVSEHAKSALETIGKTYGYDFYVRDIEDLIPPAFLNSKIILQESNGNPEKIAFETLSSGEKQQIFSVCGLLYHLLNINSVKEDASHNRFSYNYVSLLLEEIELYFHPDFQRRYITMILDGIAQLNLNNIRGINLCFVTHSPFILSDIPRSNLLIMEKGEAKSSEFLRTFGANIYDMLKHSFFLEESPIGNYAQWLITRTIIALTVWRYLQNRDVSLLFDVAISSIKNIDVKDENYLFLSRYLKQDGTFNKDEFESNYDVSTLMRHIQMVDEPFVKENLIREYYKIFPGEFNRRRRIAELEDELEKLYLGEE